MNAEHTVLATEIARVTSSDSRNGNEVTFIALLHTVDDDLVLRYVNNVTFIKDYNASFTDDIDIEFLIPKGDFVKHVYPYRNNLEMTIYKNRFGKTTEERYKFVLKGEYGGLLGGQDSFKTRDEMNKEEAVIIHGQCVNIIAEALRAKAISGIFSDTDVKSLLYSIYAKVFQNVKIYGESLSFNINIVTPSNTRIYDHIMVPPGIEVFNLPTFLQDTETGVYNGNIGTYFSKTKNFKSFDEFMSSKGAVPYKEENSLFIYPLYNTELADEQEYKLHVYATSSFKHMFADSTYVLEGSSIKIVASLDSAASNQGDETFMNEGTGYDIHESISIMNKPVDIRKEGVYVTPDNTRKANIIKERSDGMNTTRTLPSTDNVYKLRSEFLMRNGSYIKIKWQFSNDSHLYAGMPVTYSFANKEGNITTLRGVLHHVVTFYNNNTKTSTSMLGIFVDKDSNVKE